MRGVAGNVVRWENWLRQALELQVLFVCALWRAASGSGVRGCLEAEQKRGESGEGEREEGAAERVGDRWYEHSSSISEFHVPSQMRSMCV